MNITKCPFCDKQVDSLNKLCPFCGTLLPVVQEIKNEVMQTSQYKPIPKTTVKKNNVQPPVAPHKQGGFVGSLAVSVMFAFFAALFYFMEIYDGSYQFEGAIFFSFLCLCFGGISYICYSKQKIKYRLYKNNIEEYCKKEKEERERRYQQQERIRQQQIAEANKRATCPYCKSKNTKRISTTSRITSVAMTGLASKKIGKQWHCNNCKSDF